MRWLLSLVALRGWMRITVWSPPSAATADRLDDIAIGINSEILLRAGTQRRTIAALCTKSVVQLQVRRQHRWWPAGAPPPCLFPLRWWPAGAAPPTASSRVALPSALGLRPSCSTEGKGPEGEAPQEEKGKAPLAKGKAPLAPLAPPQA